MARQDKPLLLSETMAKKIDYSIIHRHFLCYCLLRLVLIIGSASGSSSKEEEDAMLLHLPRVVGVGVHDIHYGRRMAKSNKGGGDDNGCDITLYPNKDHDQNPTSIVSASGVVCNFTELSNCSIPAPDFLEAGLRFLIPGNGLFYDLSTTQPAGRYIGSINVLGNGMTQDALTLVLDDGTGTPTLDADYDFPDALEVAGYTITGQKEKYLITAGSGRYAKSTGVMTIADSLEGYPFCIIFA